MSAVPKQDLPRQPRVAAGANREMLSFRTGAEEYAIDILKVQEIRGYEPPTRIAKAPRTLLGIIDLRGTIVPIMDLRLMLGCAEVTYDASTVVVILNLAGRTVGAVVDSVSDVIELGADQIKQAPGSDQAAEASFIRGIASVGERTLIVMDIERALGSGS